MHSKTPQQLKMSTRWSIRALTCTLIALIAWPAAGQMRVEVIPELCPGLSPDQRPIVAVMDFKVKVDVTGDVGGGMASMLANALLNSGCFKVVERARLDDVMNEQALGLSGAVQESSAPSVGQIRGARFQIHGELTEFSQNTSGIGGAVRSLGRAFGRRRLADAAGAVDVRKAHVGFILKIVDTSTAEVIGSQSFDKKRTTAGFAASSWWGSSAISGGGQISKAMADAIEEGLIEAVRYLEPYRDEMMFEIGQQQAANGVANVPRPGECRLLNAMASPLRVMVMIPEEHITGVYGAYAEGRAFKFDEYEGNRHARPERGRGRGPGSMGAAQAALAATQRMIRPPDPAGETEITKRFLEHGFYLVDPKQYDELRDQERYLTVNDDIAFASELGRQFGADIVITGEAFSEFSRNINGLMSSRARVEAKAIEASTARIIAADGLHAGAVDVSEVIAGKTALRDAGGKVADYFLTQICAQDARSFRRDGSGGTLVATTGTPAADGGIVELIVSGIDFMSSSRLAKALEALSTVSSAEKKSFLDGKVTLHVAHRGSADELAEAMIQDAGNFPVEIMSLNSQQIVAAMR